MHTPLRRPTLFQLAWPLFLEQLLHMLVGMVGIFMVSHLGDNAVAGLSAANQIVTLCIMVFGFVAIGGSVVLTHHLGAGDRQGTRDVAVAAMAVNTWLGLALGVTVALLADPLLRAMQLSAALRAYAQPFLVIVGASLALEAVNLSVSAVLRAHGHTRVAMWVSLAQNAVNAAGGAVLLFGLLGVPVMGVEGVAYAAVLSRVVALLALFVLLERALGWLPRWHEFFNVPAGILQRILHIGLPAAGEKVSWYLAFVTITALSARLGDATLATQTYAMQLVHIVVLTSVAIGLATEILIGQLVGAGEFDAAYRQVLQSLKLGWLFAGGMALVVALAAPWLLGLFTTDATIIATGAVLMRIGIVLEPGRVANLVAINALRATGDVRYPVIVGVLSMWIVLVGGAWLLGTVLGLGLVGVWLAMLCDEWLRGMLMYRRWQQRGWLQRATAIHRRLRPQPC
ncbi:MATE family efflux transporter [Jeongeupia chitinilytica]|uniref:MATE family efflux transporter n=1 Tax=Jeongeupia chitinilytica TaxID=1041641 RepID=A0ABQ3GYF0_9NEIS|nr:MATE family efflux transporter [Jeongeupia chitinilytica]GHD60538.1 MATE family efflux transporter [Jeongeupia chitinilytica]